MRQEDKNLRSTLRVLKAAGVRKFQLGNLSVEFWPNPSVQEGPSIIGTEGYVVSGPAHERFKEFDPNSKEDLDVLLGTR